MKKMTILIGLLFLTGCAHYRALPLNTISSATILSDSCSEQDLVIVARAFDRRDCKKYLDRNVIEKGFKPVQLSIENRSDKNYFFSLNRIGIPCVAAQEVAEKVHTSTVARAAGYGAAALFFWPFAIPAVLDSVYSAKSNDALDSDFMHKSAKDQIISSHSHVDMLLFIPNENFRPEFRLTVIDLKSNQPKDFIVKAYG
jgi:hypothetical protein